MENARKLPHPSVQVMRCDGPGYTRANHASDAGTRRSSSKSRMFSSCSATSTMLLPTIWSHLLPSSPLH